MAKTGRTTKTTKTTTKPEAPESTLGAEVTGSQEDYERFLPAAQRLDKGAVLPFRSDASLAYHNVEKGLAAVRPIKARIEKELPLVAWAEVDGLDRLALAVAFAVTQVDHGARETGQVRPLMAEALRLREVLLSGAEAAAMAGLIPPREVAAIRQGRGPIDKANDCVALAALYGKHAAALKGKTAIGAAQVKRAAEVGTALLALLKPASVVRSRAATGSVAEAMAARDRLWTLLAARHDVLRRIGFWLWGEKAVDEHVPPLQSRLGHTRKKAAPAAPASAVG